jgi:hypothetical protein
MEGVFLFSAQVRKEEYLSLFNQNESGDRYRAPLFHMLGLLASTASNQMVDPFLSSPEY